jgi:hypothetical protein
MCFNKGNFFLWTIIVKLECTPDYKNNTYDNMQLFIEYVSTWLSWGCEYWNMLILLSQYQSNIHLIKTDLTGLG